MKYLVVKEPDAFYNFRYDLLYREQIADYDNHSYPRAKLAGCLEYLTRNLSRI